MKKVFQSILALTAILSLASCLKDKGYENQEYGIQITNSPKGVRFGQAIAQPVTVVGTGIVSNTTPINILAPEVTLEQVGVASSDVTVNVVSNPAIIPTGAGYTAMPAGLFNLSSSSFKILQGKTVSQPLNIVLPNSTLLDPTQTYAIGLELTSADNNYTLASNGRRIVVAISIKNKYDGIWKLTGNHTRTTPDYSGRYVDETVELRTVSATRVNMFMPRFNAFAHPIGVVSAAGVSIGYYGTFTACWQFNAQDQIVSWDWTPYATTLPTDMIPGTNSRYEAQSGSTPPKIFAYFRYNNNPLRGFYDTLTRIGDRP